jgi:hypothetical protein
VIAGPAGHRRLDRFRKHRNRVAEHRDVQTAPAFLLDRRRTRAR